VRGGAIEVGLVPADMLFQAAGKTGPFRFMDASYESIRSLLSVPSEVLTLVVRRDADITDLDALKRRRVNLGNPGSRGRWMADRLLAAKGWSVDDFALAEELPADQQSLALCHGRVEAIVYATGHPSVAVERLMRLCDATLMRVGGPAVDKAVAEQPYLAAASIPPDLYPSHPGVMHTVGVPTIVVVSADLDDRIAHRVVSAVLERLGRLKATLPGLRGVDARAMTKTGLPTPAHPGAARYFREHGLD